MVMFSLSPSVDVKETDLTLITPAVATSIGAFSGVFQWGPVNEPQVVDNEKTLVALYGQPNLDTQVDFLTAASFLAYSNNLRVVRVVGENAKNAYVGGNTAPVIFNEVDHEGKLAGVLKDVKFAAKYPGELGNSLRVSFADAKTFDKWKYRSHFGAAVVVNKVGSFEDSAATVTFEDTQTTTGLAVGQHVAGVGIDADTTILSIDSLTQITLSKNPTAQGQKTALTFTSYTGAPGTSAYVGSKGGKNDEIHFVVVDEQGYWSGTAGTVLERFTGLSKAFNALDYTGTANYYVDFINRNSQYVWVGGKHEGSDWGQDATKTFSDLPAAFDEALTGGVSDNKPSVGARIAGYEAFQKAESIDVSLVIVAGLDDEVEQATLANYVIESIAAYRKDCIALVGPNKAATVNNRGNELQALLNFRNQIADSSYGVLVSGWKQMYNRYTDQYVFVPLTGDIAGICAHTDDVADPWFSPAGHNRGHIKNVVKLSYNPGSKAERDTLYQNGINPVTAQIGEGTVLLGDKTLQRKPSAFDRINVRRLFIGLEKSIAAMAKFHLFEVNDEFERRRFVARVTPLLREVQGRRGITDFKVTCDLSNNTPAVINGNGFVGDIHVKPTRSINFISLNFIATPEGVKFEEVAQ